MSVQCSGGSRSFAKANNILEDEECSGWSLEVPKHLQKPNLRQRKGLGHCLVVCWRSDPLQLSESWRNNYSWEVHSANQWEALKTAMPAASTGQQKGPNPPKQRPKACCTTNTSKVEPIGLQRFVSSAIFTWPLTNRLSLLRASQQLFAGKRLPPQQEAEHAFQEFVESQSTNFFTLQA